MAEQHGASSSRTLAEKLDHLFHTVRDDAGREYSLEDVARAIAERGGPTISATYIWQLRKGTRTNPRMSHLEALAGHFGVAPAYFFADELADRFVQELTVVAALRDPAVREMATTANRLAPRSREVLAGLTAHLSRLERGETA